MPTHHEEREELTIDNLGRHLVLGHHQVLCDGGQLLVDAIIPGHNAVYCYSEKL